MKITVFILALLSSATANAGALHCFTHDREIQVCTAGVCPKDCKIDGYEYLVVGGNWCTSDLERGGCKDTYLFTLNAYPDDELVLQIGNTCSGVSAPHSNSRHIWRPLAQVNTFELLHQKRTGPNAPFKDVSVRRAQFVDGKIVLYRLEGPVDLTRESCK